MSPSACPPKININYDYITAYESRKALEKRKPFGNAGLKFTRHGIPGRQVVRGTSDSPAGVTPQSI